MPEELRKAATLPDLSLRIMLRVLEEEGLETEGVLEAADLPDGLPRLPGTLTPAREFASQRAFVAATGHRPDLWLHTGLRYHLPKYGELGMALLTAPNLDDMIATIGTMRELDYSLARSQPIRSRGMLVGAEFDASEADEALREFSLYRDLGAMTTALRDVWNDRFPISQIEVALPRPVRGNFTLGHQAIVFDADRTAITWDGKLSKALLYYGDEVLHAAYLAECRLKARLRGAKDELVDMLARGLTRGTGEMPSLASLAAEVGMSERTMQRRLQERGLRFRDLVEEARRQVSIELLTFSETPIAMIAWRLGYSDTTSFAHAFRRWTGISPGAARHGDKSSRKPKA